MPKVSYTITLKAVYNHERTYKEALQNRINNLIAEAVDRLGYAGPAASLEGAVNVDIKKEDINEEESNSSKPL